MEYLFLMIKILKVISFFLLIHVITGCVSYTSEIKTDAKPKLESGYIYGSFLLNSYMGSRRYTADLKSYLDMGIMLENVSTLNNYTIQFKVADPHSMIAVTPGEYLLSKIVFADGVSTFSSNKIIKNGKSKAFTVKPGLAYYIGDLSGETNYLVYPSASPRTGGTAASWEVKSWVDNYEETTKLIKKKYPHFYQLDTIRAVK
jgi:hypothetical protein